MSEIQKRHDAMLHYVQEMLTEYAVWAEGTEETIVLEDPFDNALLAMFEVFEHGDIPANLRPLTRRVEDLATDYREYRQQILDTGRTSLPPASMGAYIKDITALLFDVQQPDKPPLETIADFDRQKVSDRQIAIAYGWFKENGQPDEPRVRKQRADNPNLEVENPHNAALRERQKRDQEAIERAIAKQRHREEVASKPAPESVEELLEQGVGAKQIADMKKMTVGELERYCYENGLDMPGTSSLESAAAEVAQEAEDQRREFLDNTPTNQHESVDEIEDEPISELSLEEQIIDAAREGGLSHAEIAEMLDISRQKVTAVLSRQDEVVA